MASLCGECNDDIYEICRKYECLCLEPMDGDVAEVGDVHTETHKRRYQLLSGVWTLVNDGVDDGNNQASTLTQAVKSVSHLERVKSTNAMDLIRLPQMPQMPQIPQMGKAKDQEDTSPSSTKQTTSKKCNKPNKAGSKTRDLIIAAIDAIDKQKYEEAKELLLSLVDGKKRLVLG